MAFQQIDMSAEPTHRGPYGWLWGAPGARKTTALAQAFPDYLFIVTSPGAMDGPRSWLAGQGKPYPKNVMLWADERDTAGNPIHFSKRSWFRVFCQFMGLTRHWAIKVREEHDGAIALPKGPTMWRGSVFNGFAMPISAKGVVFSEFTTLFGWIVRDLHAEFGKGYGSPAMDKAFGLFDGMTAWNGETNLGLVLEGHPAPKTYEEGANIAKATPVAAYGPDLYWRKARMAALRHVDFSWELTGAPTKADTIDSVLLTRAERDTNHEARRTRMRQPETDPGNPWSERRHRINLTQEGITVRDVCREVGFIAD